MGNAALVSGNNPVKYVDPDGREIELYVFRNTKSYDISTNRNTPKNVALDFVALYNTETNEISFFFGVQTVANYPSTDRKNNSVPSTYNDTIAPGNFDLKVFTTTNVAAGDAGIITNAKTIDGRNVDANGITENALSSGRGLIHSAEKPDGSGNEYNVPYSQQCFIFSKEDNKRFFDTLKNAGVKQGDVIKGQLYDFIEF